MNLTIIITRLSDLDKKFIDISETCLSISKDLENEIITNKTKENVVKVKRWIFSISEKINDMSATLKGGTEKYSEENIYHIISILSHMNNVLKEWKDIILILSMRVIEMEVYQLTSEDNKYID